VLQYFSLYKPSLFKQAVVCLSFLSCYVMQIILNRLPCFHSPIYFSRRFSFALFQEVSYFPWSVLPYQDIFLIRFFIYLLYIKPLVPRQWTVQYWFFSSLGRSSLGYLLVAFISTTLAIFPSSSAPPDALNSLIIAKRYFLCPLLLSN